MPEILDIATTEYIQNGRPGSRTSLALLNKSRKIWRRVMERERHWEKSDLALGARDIGHGYYSACTKRASRVSDLAGARGRKENIARYYREGDRE